MMINPEQPPYPPESLVYFTDENGVKKGKVKGINILIEARGITTQWAIEEKTHKETIIHQREVGEIAKEWVNILEKAEKKIYAFKSQKEGTDDDGIF